MRGAAFPIGLAVLFGVMNGIYIFKPMILEARVAALQREGVDIGGAGQEGKVEEEIRRQNEIAKQKKKEAKEEGGK